MGCLTAPFKLLFVLVLILGGVAAWLYRDRLLELGRRAAGDRPSAVLHTSGRPTERGLRLARVRIDSLARGLADSVVLSASEAASLLGAGLEPSVRRQLDSMQVELRDDNVAVRALLSTRRLPRELVGPLAVGLRDHEPIEAAGPLRFVDAGQGAWEVRQLQIRDFPFPRDAVPRLMARALGDSSGRALTVKLPRGVRGLRVRADGITLYGAPRA